MSEKTLFLVDGSNNIYRSYFAIRGLTNSSGLATNAVYGFTMMLRKMLRDHKPHSVAVAFDVSGSTHRQEQFADYKKDRKPMPDDLSIQIPLAREVLAGFGIPVIGVTDYEADDLLGSLACEAQRRGYRVVIATSDKDFFQLVGDGIFVYHTGREILYDAEGVREVFGLPPDKVLDVMAIWGDAIDNIPGVPGIGEKGAKSLITEFGSLDNLLANLEQVKKTSHRKALETFSDQARMSRDLARIKCDLPIDVDFTQYELGEPDRAKLHEIFTRLEFAALSQEFVPEQPAAKRDYRLITSRIELDAFLSRSEGAVAIHAEPLTADSISPIAAVAVSLERGASAIIPVLPALGGSEQLKDGIAELLRSGRMIAAHDMKTQVRRLVAEGLPRPQSFADTMIMSYVLNPGLASHLLANIAAERLGMSIQSRKDLAKSSPTLTFDPAWISYLGEKSDATITLLERLSTELDKDTALESIYETIERPLIAILASIEERGIGIDTGLLETMSTTIGAQLDELERKIYAEAGQEFNINSPSQLATILFEKLQYPVLKKTQKTKSSSTGVEVLNELASYGYAVPKLIVEHRELHKLKSTYLDALPQLVGSDGRLHTSFNQAVASTGRLSSSDPNLQNIPIRTQQGREIRRAFRADEGNVLLAADYSQIELRILAHITQDAGLIEAFNRGADIHRSTAAKIFNVMEPLVTTEQRRAAKTINFGVLYGMSAFRLSNELGISGTEAKNFIEAYFGRYPRIREYLDKTLDEARSTGKVTTLLGRVRYIPEIHNRSWTVRGNAERMATNAPIQGTAADLLKLAMIALDARLKSEAPRSAMILTVHDEIVIEGPESEIENIESIVKGTMEGIYPMSVPLAVDTGWGRSWYEAKQ
ncbi:MAG TPA: DNA polymerase I [Thermoanaerobaculia bacterium]|nr:DNA polymerase I [Thermoanaerobaculia bacterium]